VISGKTKEKEVNMTIGGFLVLLLIAAICGAIAQALVGYSTGGCLISAVVGIIGALIGYWLARQLNLPLLLTINIQGQPFPIVWSIIGSSIFVAVLTLITGRR
jgi:uncharacterized membrane protein YeaQ/YmgE (transglycosylase-associated protein family)